MSTSANEYCVQFTSDPFQPEWQEIVYFSWDGDRWRPRFVTDLPVNISIKKWCEDGIVKVVSINGQMRLLGVGPDSTEFFELMDRQLGGIRYRCVCIENSEDAFHITK